MFTIQLHIFIGNHKPNDMSKANSYYVLLNELERVNHRINYHYSSGTEPEKQDLEYQEKISGELEALRKEPGTDTETAEKLQSNLFRTLEYLLNEFSNIRKRGAFPLLHQNTTKSDGLFGKILTDLKTNILNSGYSHPSDIAYSDEQWDSASLNGILEAYFNDLKTKHFKSELEAVDYYIAMRDDINHVREKLKSVKVI